MRDFAVKSVIQEISTEEFIRIRVGTGKPKFKGDLINYVLEPIDKNEREIYEGDIVRIKNSLIEIEWEVIFDTIDLAFEVYDKENDCKEMLWYTNKELEVLRQYIR